MIRTRKEKVEINKNLFSLWKTGERNCIKHGYGLTNNKVFMEDWKKKLINKSQRKSKPLFFMNYERGKK